MDDARCGDCDDAAWLGDFSAVSSNATICLVAVIGILFIGEHLNKIALQQAEPIKSITYTLYYCIPHIELFNLRDQL